MRESKRASVRNRAGDRCEYCGIHQRHDAFLPFHVEHVLPKHSHYAGGLAGALGENSLAIALIALIALLPWRPGAAPAFYSEPALAVRVRAS